MQKVIIKVKAFIITVILFTDFHTYLTSYNAIQSIDIEV